MLVALQRVSTALYLLLGWSGLVALQPLVEVLSTPALILLVPGGGLYTLGVAFFHWERIPYQNAIWLASCWLLPRVTTAPSWAAWCWADLVREVEPQGLGVIRP